VNADQPANTVFANIRAIFDSAKSKGKVHLRPVLKIRVCIGFSLDLHTIGAWA
jgi:hypothetical protein